jgi:glucuronate isomerase
VTDPDLLFPPDPRTRELARRLFGHARDLPIISPHGHVDPWLLADDQAFPDPARLLIVPDHYVTRLLYSQGVDLDALGVPRRDGGPVQTDGRAIWRLLARHWAAFRGTPSRLWLELTLAEVFQVSPVLSEESADDVYDALADRIATDAFRPRALFERFGIEVLATTESATDDLSAHAKLAADGWSGRVITTFRPDDVVDPEWDGWADRIDRLGELTGFPVDSYDGYLAAVEARRETFRVAGARSTDHGHPTARTLDLSPTEAAQLYLRLRQAERVDPHDAEAFRAHMLLQFARMSTQDGLVMQLHPGAVRNHNGHLHRTYGRDTGGDIPQAGEYTHALRPLLDRYGHDPRLRLVLYTLDETTFGRELAPLAGGYPAVYLGAPWWFLDSPDGLRRFRETATDTAGFANTSGFVDDTRAFCSIPVRHQVARRVDAAYLARLVVEGRLTEDDAADTIADLAYHLPKRVFATLAERNQANSVATLAERNQANTPRLED